MLSSHFLFAARAARNLTLSRHDVARRGLVKSNSFGIRSTPPQPVKRAGLLRPSLLIA